MNSSTSRLLQAATEIVGSHRMLAGRLGISETLLMKFMDGTLQMPDWLLLKAVDILLAEREMRLAGDTPVGGPFSGGLPA